MFPPAAFVFLTLTILELFALVKVASAIGVLNAIGLLIVISFLGTLLLRTRGSGFLQTTIQNLQGASGTPGSKDSGSKDSASANLASQFLALLGSVLLVIPGFVTAAIGVLLLIPPVRTLLAPLVQSRTPKFQFLTPDFASGPASGFAGFADRASGFGFGRDFVDVTLIEDDVDGTASNGNTQHGESDSSDSSSQRPTRPELN